MRVDLVLESTVRQSPRVVQMAGIFDVPVDEKSRVEFHFDVPIEDRPWQVGLIVGPSGAGKSSVARELFGDAMVDGYDWPDDGAIVDGFGSLPIRETTAALNSVGFSSPPNWVRPFRVLSNGERFRANMARVLVDPRPLIAVDEFTSVVDRQVARVGAHSIAKAVRAKSGKQFVAVTCHYDVEEWLQPDWTLEPHTGRFVWRSVQRRPTVELEVVRCTHEAWRWFAPHHYLSADLHRGARCFMGLVDGTPAAFAGLIHFPHPKVRDITTISRVVVLPEFQGLGLGAHAFPNALGAIARANGRCLRIGTSHPALNAALARSTSWRMVSPPSFANRAGRTSSSSVGRSVATTRRVGHYEYAGPPLADTKLASSMWNSPSLPSTGVGAHG